MHRTQIQVPPAMMRELRGLAKAQDVSVAELIRRGISLMLRSRTTRDPAEIRRRAMQAVGRFSSGKRRWAASHDDEFIAGSGH
jgi:Arc/MetJ-type ribon-helix-helix transcriptional regulator